MRGLALLLAVLIALAGCTQPGDRPDRVPVVDPNAQDEEPDDDPEPEPDDNQTAGPDDNATDQNETEEPGLTASISVTFDSNNSLLAYFDLDAADPSQEEEADNGTGGNETGDDNTTLQIDWTLDVGHNDTVLNGSQLPATANYTYNATGNYTVVFTVDNGEENHTVTLNLTVSEAGVVQTASASWSAGPYGCGAGDYPSHESGLPAAGALYGEVALDAAAPGVNYQATFNYTQPEAELLGGAVQFFNDAGESVGSDFGNTITSVVPDGAVVAVFSNCGPAGASVEFTVDPTIEVPAE